MKKITLFIILLLTSCSQADFNGLIDEEIKKFEEVPPIVAAPTPYAPSNAGIIATNKPVFKWNASNSAVSYRLEVADNSNFNQLLVKQEGLTDLQYEISETEALPDEGVFYWRVIAVADDGRESDRAVFIFSVDMSLPDIGASVDKAEVFPEDDFVLTFSSSESGTYIISKSQSVDFTDEIILKSGTVNILDVDTDKPVDFTGEDLYADCVNYLKVKVIDSGGNVGADVVSLLRKEIIDDTPVELLSPVDNSIVNNNPTFVWTSRLGAKSYVIEISETESFTDCVIHKEQVETQYTLLESDLINISQLKEITYFWRIITQYKDHNIISNINSINILETNTIYVDINSSVEIEAGNRTRPFKSIQRAIELAGYHSKKEVFISQGEYNEDVNMRAGISIYGGFDSSSDWSRDLENNITIIRAQSDCAVKSSNITMEYQDTTVIEGFTLYAGDVDLNAAIYNVNSSIIIKNNIIHGGNSGVCQGIYNNSSNTIISNNCIFVTTISSGLQNVFGIRNDFSSPIIYNNLIKVNVNSDQSGGFGVGIKNTESSPEISNNIIIVIGKASTIVGIYNLNESDSIIKNNTVFSMAQNTYISVIRNNISSSPLIDNNILFSNNIGTYESIGIFESTTDDDPSELLNNLIFHCPSAIYRNENSTNINDTNNNGILNKIDAGSDEELDLENIVRTGGVNNGNITLLTGQTENDVFSIGFDINNYTTWQIKGAGPADLDNSGSYSPGDIGADVSCVGFNK